MTDVPISIRAGVDWWIQFAYTDADSNPIALTAPKIEMRAARSSRASLLFSSETDPATLAVTQPQAHKVLVKLASGATANGRARAGFWDAYAKDPDGNTVLLGAGTVRIEANVSAL